MFPLVKFVAIFGGVAAGAQVASGLVRGVKEVCRGRPVAGLLEAADGMAAPIMTAVGEVSKFVKEVHDAVTLPWKQEESNGMPQEQAPAEQMKVCCQKEHAEGSASANGVLSLAARS